MHSTHGKMHPIRRLPCWQANSPRLIAQWMPESWAGNASPLFHLWVERCINIYSDVI